jgi:hypothetical protein
MLQKMAGTLDLSLDPLLIPLLAAAASMGLLRIAAALCESVTQHHDRRAIAKVSRVTDEPPAARE